MSNQVWVRWKDSTSNEWLFDKVRNLEGGADVSDLRKAFVKDRIIDIDAAKVEVREREGGEKLEEDKVLENYFLTGKKEENNVPGRSKANALFLTFEQQQAVVPDVERLLPLLAALPDFFREVGISRKSRLNCWERESMRTSGSKRSRRFRNKVIEYYKSASNSGKKVKCQILDEYICEEDAEDEATGIIAAHIWKASTRGHGLEEFGLKPEEVNSPKNGLFLTKGLEVAFDNQQICFLYNLLESKIVLWVADTSLMDETIVGSGKMTTDGSDMKFSDVHQKPLVCPPNCLPFRRLLSWHARLTLELRPQTVDARRLTPAYDNSPGREHTDIDPIARAISEMVEPLDDAST